MVSSIVLYACCWALLCACAPSTGHVSQATTVSYDHVDGDQLDLSLGEQYMTLLPVNRIFVDDSSNFLADAAVILPRVASLIANQSPRWVSITVVDRSVNGQPSALSAKQADVLVRYLGAQALGAHMVYARLPGAGSDFGGKPGISFFSDVNRDLAYIEISYGGVAA